VLVVDVVEVVEVDDVVDVVDVVDVLVVDDVVLEVARVVVVVRWGTVVGALVVVLGTDGSVVLGTVVGGTVLVVVVVDDGCPWGTVKVAGANGVDAPK
jgi:hypothetical protein